MKILEFPLLADQNVALDLVQALRGQGRDVLRIAELGMATATDREILCRAHDLGRVVITHDSDFGTLAVRGGEPLLGILFLRPGTLDASVYARIVQAIESVEATPEPPFIAVAELRSDMVRVRLRSLNSTNRGF